MFGKRGFPAKVIERFILLALGVLFSEIALRFIGYGPVGAIKAEQALSMVERSDKVGWILKPGKTSTNYIGEHGPIVINVTPKSSRAASNEQVAGTFDSAKKQLLFLGCSFVMGTSLYDEETLPWLVQRDVPNLTVINFGTPGYGSCQSLIQLKEYLKTNSSNVAAVIYGFPPFHEPRNVGDPFYLWRLAYASSSKSASMPYCDIDESGALQEHPPEEFNVKFPWLVSHFSVATLVSDAYYRIKSRKRVSQSELVTVKIISELKKLSDSVGAKFVVLFEKHDEQSFDTYSKELAGMGIPYIDGRHPKEDMKSMAARNGAHPGLQLNAYWAQLVVDYLRKSELGTESR